MLLSHLSWLASGYESLYDKDIDSDIHYKNMATSAPSQWYIDWKKCSVVFACHLQLNQNKLNPDGETFVLKVSVWLASCNVLFIS